MAGIFISYRRADSDGWAGRLRDALRVRFGDRVFQDVESIADGEIFSEVIDRALQECDVALVIIGPNWASARDAGGRRLDQTDDWVRTETSLVLNRPIRVIPVLVGGASMPRAEDLPEELRSLTKRQAREIRSNSWDSDVALLTSHLKQIVGQRRKRPVWLYAVAPLLLVAAVGAFVGHRYFGQPGVVPAGGQATATPAAAPVAQRVAPGAAPVALAPEASPENAAAKKEPQTAKPIKAEPASALASAQTSPAAAAAPTAAPAKSALAAPPAPERAPAKIARAEPPPAKAAAAPERQAPAPAPESRKAAVTPAPEPRKAVVAPAPAAAPQPPGPAAAQTQEPRTSATALSAAETPSPRIPPSAPAVAEARSPEPAPAAPAAAPALVARAAPVNLPNRPAAARELKVGDSWTYRLREVQFNRNLATVTHEVGGGDPSGIREWVRAGAQKVGAGPGGDAAGAGTQRRLALEPRIFEQQINHDAKLVEFAPFMTAFSELKPGVKWTGIAGATSADSMNDWRFSGKVTGRERVRVPAGSFDAIKAELEGELELSFPSTRDPFNETAASYQTYTVWFVPEVGRAVKYERRTYNRGRRLLDHERYELVSYQLK